MVEEGCSATSVKMKNIKATVSCWLNKQQSELDGIQHQGMGIKK